MKKRGVVLFLVMFFFILMTTTVYAETRWDTLQPVKKTTSDGIDITYQTKVAFEYDCWEQRGETICDTSTKIGVDIQVDVMITIPSDYNKDSIVIAPEILQTLAKENYEKLELSENSGYLQLNNSLQPGDNIKVNLTIVNHSKYAYDYDKKSFDIFPVEDATFSREDNQNSTFNGLTLKENYRVYRIANPALKDLKYVGQSHANEKVTDENIDQSLKEIKDLSGNQKYPNGIRDLSKYYLDYYNQKYNTNHTRLDQFSYGVIREILGYNDSLEQASRYINNLPTLKRAYETYRSQLIEKMKQEGVANPRPNQQDVLTFAGFNTKASYQENFAEFAKSAYGEMCGSEITSLDTMCEDAQAEFFSNYGSELSPSVYETNEDILNLTYDYFFNKGLAFGFEDDEVTGANSNHYSVGEYMRDENKGEEQIKNNIGSLKSGSINDIRMSFYINGPYICNTYLGYYFMTNMHFSYSAKNGKLVINYVDTDGNKLTEEITRMDKVGELYLTDKKSFDGYTFVKVEGNVTGEYIDGVIYVTYIYTKVATGDVEVIPPKTGVNQPFQSKGETKISSLNYYKKEEEEFI